MGRKAPGRQGQYATEVCCTPGLNDDAEDSANARLIAATPELLEAIQLFVDAFNLPDDRSEDRTVEMWFRKPIKLARMAIAKAEGSAD